MMYQAAILNLGNNAGPGFSLMHAGEKHGEVGDALADAQKIPPLPNGQNSGIWHKIIIVSND